MIPQYVLCRTCGWRQGGLDSWNGRACKCGHASAPQTTCSACNYSGIIDRKVCPTCSGSGLVPMASASGAA